MEVKLPDGVKAEVKGDTLIVTGKLGSNTRKFNDVLLTLSAGHDRITIDHTTAKKLVHKAANAEKSFTKEIQNDIEGVSKHYERNMKTVYAHFPINVEVKDNIVRINNIIGERVPRLSKIIGSTKVEVKGQSVRIYGTSLDDVTQTAANIRTACVMRKKDTRVFQDGLYFEV